MKRKSTGFMALLALTFLLNGCIKENLADCNFNITVEFIKQSNCSSAVLEAQTGKISVFAFNESGIFIDQFSDDNAVFGAQYKLPLSLPQGNYTLVAWTGTTGAQFENLVKGRSTLTELYVPSYSMKNGNKEAITQPMFTGSVSHVNAIDGVTQLIRLAGTAKSLNISFSGLPVNHNYQARISYNAVQYKFENSLLSLLADDHYTMAGFVAQTAEPDNYKAETSLLWPIGSYTPQLTIRDLSTGADVFSADIKALIAQLTQVDLDCERVINLELTQDPVQPAIINVVINGWKVQYINNEI